MLKKWCLFGKFTMKQSIKGAETSSIILTIAQLWKN